MAVAGRSQAEKSTSYPPPRVVIEGVHPEVDSGRFPIKRTEGEGVVVQADVFAEGHDKIAAIVKYRPVGASAWREAPLEPLGNDRWKGRFVVDRKGRWEYTVEGWVDHFATWFDEVFKKNEAGLNLQSELLEGARLVEEAAARSTGEDAAWLAQQAAVLKSDRPQPERVSAALDHDLTEKMRAYPDRQGTRVYDRVLGITVERERARFGSWYEMFPRSASPEPDRHGTFKDVEARLPYVAGMGFDVLYLPPIHPVGRAFRKGPNNSLEPGPNDPGSPWAIGSEEGGHTAIHPELGTLADFDHLVKRAREYGLEIALDIAFQCSPDHPWVKQHPEWFRHRPDGTIKYAENPPKKYQDIYPINFETPHWKSLWEGLRDVFLFWVDHGVTIFRVDNPHTKAFPFWEWCIREIWDRCPDAIFLAEAFTRPKVMKHLAKSGYPQSYSYFTWRNDKWGLTEYFTELYQSDVVEYMRPNLFANTPDILHEFLQVSGRPGFMIRFVLAATLGATYGIYGPPFEQCVGTPVKHGSEEYLDSEKYQIRHWDLNAPGNLRDFITRVNTARRENRALQFNRGLKFYHVDNDKLICYGKTAPDGSNLVVTIVNLDPFHKQSGWVHLPIDDLGLGTDGDHSFQVHDLISDARYLWNGAWNYVELDPHVCPATCSASASESKPSRISTTTLDPPRRQNMREVESGAGSARTS